MAEIIYKRFKLNLYVKQFDQQTMKHYWWNLHLTHLNLHCTHIFISSWEEVFGIVFIYNTPLHKHRDKGKQI